MTHLKDENDLDHDNGMGAGDFSRRGLILGGLAVALAACTPVAQEQITYASAFTQPRNVDPKYRRQRVRYDSREKPGTIVVDTRNHFLYFVEKDGYATRYGVGVGREGMSLKGRAVVGRKAEWPSWTPTANMMRRDPELRQYAGGVPGGPHNPLGARALYLHRGGRDTMFRIHGTNEPWSIGQSMSSGCIRLLNEDVIHLYERARVGTQVRII